MVFFTVFGDLPLIKYTKRRIKIWIKRENVKIWVKIVLKM